MVSRAPVRLGLAELAETLAMSAHLEQMVGALWSKLALGRLEAEQGG